MKYKRNRQAVSAEINQHLFAFSPNRYGTGNIALIPS